MKHASIIVRAEWDEDAAVWYATSADIEGLAVEADSLDALHKKTFDALADLLELNGLQSDLPEIPVHFMANQVSRRPNPHR